MNTEGEQIEVVENVQGDLDDLEILQLEAEKEDTGSGTKQQDPLNILYKHHPEAVLDYKETVFQKLPLKSAPPFTEEDLDKNHRSQPFLTQYEKTRILGFRTNQLAQGARPLLLNGVPEHVKTTLEIARLELEQRRLPFVVKRPMPDGSFEYWRLSDLLIL
jgi:DNA-directed RNA polymerase I, II, and III subunit RPABC2